MFKKFVLSVMLFLAGVMSAPFHPVHHWHGMQVLQLVHQEGVPESVEAWKVEIARRPGFENAFVLFSHGGDDHGVWRCGAELGSHFRNMPVQMVADELHKKNPDRIIVLIMCNPGHARITTPNVYYALDSVWFETDRSTDASERAKVVPQFVGNIFEFVTGDGR